MTYFAENRYDFKKGLIPKDLCAVATQYALFRQKYFDHREDPVTGQIPNTTSILSICFLCSTCSTSLFQPVF